MFPQFPDFKQVEIGDADIIEDYARFAGDNLCELSFVNLMIWRDCFQASFTFLNGCLCIRVNPSGESPFFLEPLGEKGVSEAARMCLSHTGKLSRVSAEIARSLGSADYRARALRDHFDYIYRVEDLAALKGRKFDGKRNHIRRMKKSHPDCEYVSLEKNHARNALELFDLWRSSKQREGCAPRPGISCQKKAIERAFEKYDELGLIGGALVSKDSLMGFMIGSALNADTACAHLSCTRSDVAGAPQTLLWEACKNTFSGFKFINMEQDLGLSGLRKMKISYHPTRLAEKFEIETANCVIPACS